MFFSLADYQNHSHFASLRALILSPEYRNGEYSFSYEENCKISVMKGTNNMAIFSEGYKTKIILFLRVSRNNFLKESGKKTSSVGGGGGGGR